MFGFSAEATPSCRRNAITVRAAFIVNSLANQHTTNKVFFGSNSLPNAGILR